MSDEEVIKRRLVFDGDGTGDDRRLNLMLKMVGKLMTAGDDNPKETQQICDKFLTQLDLCELSQKKSLLLEKSNKKQLAKYKELHKEYEDKIEKIKKEIEVQKSELEKAQRIKQNKIMYDLLAKNIAEEPARKETNQKRLALQAELKELGEVRKNYDEMLSQRQKQFHVLSTSANMLKEILEKDDKIEQTKTEPMSE